MGSSHSSNFSSMAASASSSVSTSIDQGARSGGLASNSITQMCDNLRVEVSGNCQVNACNMTDVAQGNTASSMQETLQKAALNNKTNQSMRQALKSAAQSVVKGFNFGNYAEAQNVSRQTMSAASRISNRISQECIQDNAVVNSVMQSCQNATLAARDAGLDPSAQNGGCGIEACNMTGVRQQNMIDSMQKCMQESNVTNEVIQDLQQKADLVAVAKAEGIDLMSWAGWLFVALGAASCVVVYGGTSIYSNTVKEVTTGAMLIGIGVCLMVFGGLVGATQAERWVRKGLFKRQMMASATPSADQFAAGVDIFCNGSNDSRCGLANSLRPTAKPTWTQLERYCAQEPGPLDTQYANFCNKVTKKPHTSTGLIGVPYRKMGGDSMCVARDANACLQHSGDAQACEAAGCTMDSSNSRCVSQNTSCASLSGVACDAAAECQTLTGDGVTLAVVNQTCEADDDCIAWRWVQTSGTGGDFYAPMKQNSGGAIGFFKDLLEGPEETRCDRRKCLAEGMTSDACQKCCRGVACTGHTPCNPILFDPCSQYTTEAQCNGADRYDLWDEDDQTLGGCTIKCGWSKPITESGGVKEEGEHACRRVRCNHDDKDSNDLTARACFHARCARFACQYCNDNEVARGVGTLFTRKNFVHLGSCDGDDDPNCRLFKSENVEWSGIDYPSWISPLKVARSAECWNANNEWAGVKMPAPTYDAAFLITAGMVGLGVLFMALGTGLKIKDALVGNKGVVKPNAPPLMSTSLKK